MKNKRNELSMAENIFVTEYMQNNGNGSAAYRIAFPRALKWRDKTVWERSCRLLVTSKVQARIAALRKSIAAKLEADLSRVVNELALVALSDPLADIISARGTIKLVLDWPESARRAVSSIEVYEEYTGTGRAKQLSGYTKRVRFWDKNAALEKLMRFFGGYERDNKQNALALGTLSREALELINRNLELRTSGDRSVTDEQTGVAKPPIH